ncbi:uncharacterized protein LOC132988285 [Labrus mixtus]|uniref:uncharacterized protein LOC132988285 n=1 Tax=Labrus mixtus TaxID=508554 RepID=UPI0029C09AEC|nr:uncharacterized protein LOC132988285 [Labrus mixtus]
MSVPLIWTAVIVSLHTSFISLYSHRKQLLELLQDHKEYSNMNCFLFLMCYIAIVGAQMSGSEGLTPDDLGDDIDDNGIPASQSTSQATPSRIITHNTEANSISGTRLSSTQSLTDVPQSRSTSWPPKTTQFDALFFKMDHLQVLMVSGGLIILCFILLLSVFLLAWKVCRLNRRIKELSSNADLISTSEYWMGTGKKNKSKSETEPKETTVLMSDMSQTKEERGNGTTKEEGEKENNTEEGDTTKSEEAAATPVAACESSPSSEPKEEAIEATAAPSPEGTEEPKDVV